MDFKTLAVEQLLGPLNEVEKKNAPPALYARGDIGILQNKQIVSIVGSRKASPQGLRRAGSLARELATRGVVVLSGLAEGIDTEAHLAAIEKGGHTIGVIGTPVDRTFPAKNKDLQELIACEHLLLSQFPIGAKTSKASFPQRNLTMALISDATVIVEAKDKSGSLHQGWEALRLGKPLIIMQSAVDDNSLAWPKEFLKYGAFIINRDEIDAFVRNLPSHDPVTDAELAF